MCIDKLTGSKQKRVHKIDKTKRGELKWQFVIEKKQKSTHFFPKFVILIEQKVYVVR